jgi:hypothetical protein
VSFATGEVLIRAANDTAAWALAISEYRLAIDESVDAFLFDPDHNAIWQKGPWEGPGS